MTNQGSVKEFPWGGGGGAMRTFSTFLEMPSNSYYSFEYIESVIVSFKSSSNVIRLYGYSLIIITRKIKLSHSVPNVTKNDT